MLCAESPFYFATRFNAWFAGDFRSTPSDVQGSLGVGGDVEFITNSTHGYSIADQLPPFNCTAGQSLLEEVTMLVDGYISWETGRHYYGHILTGLPFSSNIGPFVSNGLAASCDILSGNVIDHDLVNTYLANTSTAVSSLPDTGSYSTVESDLFIQPGTPNSHNQVIVSIPGSVMNSTLGFFFDGSDIDINTTIIFNIDSESITFGNFSLEVLIPFRTRTLWNFYEATNLTIQYVSIEGSFLAPFADWIDTKVIHAICMQKSNAYLDLRRE